MTHEVDWYSPAPLWSGRLENGTGDRLREPALVRFAQDDFMGELQRVLETAPQALGGTLAENSSDGEADGEDDDPLSFYQPAHERYYMVTASLVCRERGLPDRAVDTTNDERTAFVLRRLITPDDGSADEAREYGWTGTAWKPVADPTEVADAEQPLKMFPKSYAPQARAEQMKGDRRLWAGLIPVGKRDTYETAPVRHDELIGTTSGEADDIGRTNGGGAESGDGASELPPKGDVLSDPRKTKFATRVLGAFEGVLDALKQNSTVTAADVRDPLVFAWLDLWQFLGEHFEGMQGTIIADEPIGSDDSDVLRVLDAIDVSGLNGWSSATDALRAVAAHESDVEAGTLSGVLKPSDLPSRNDDTLDRDALKDIINEILADRVDGLGTNNDTPALQEVVHEDLGTLDDPNALTGDLKPPVTGSTGGGQYVVRCLYERPNCPPQSRTVVSQPSKTFQLASFFDADAPARDINITLPSSAMKDLRASSQSVSLVFTKELRRQAERVQKITLDELQEGEVGKAPTVNIGMICSLSIPIITICALVLLIIMVALLNIVFWWLPFFKICFPLPSTD